MTDHADPILEKRARVSRLVSLGLRVGGGLFLLASLVFFVAFATEFTSLATNVITLCLLLGSVILAPAMVFHYAVKAADRADREDSW